MDPSHGNYYFHVPRHLAESRTTSLVQTQREKQVVRSFIKAIREFVLQSVSLSESYVPKAFPNLVSAHFGLSVVLYVLSPCSPNKW